METLFLAGAEANRVRPLWEEVFCEDSAKFTEYYFQNKIPFNLVFAGVEESEIVSMMHLTPYMTNRGEEVCYMVGVATKESFRRQGCMNELMKEAFDCMESEQEPFVFLMPANPKIYEPYGFTFIYDKKEFLLNEKRLSASLLNEASQNEGNFSLLVKNKGILEIHTVKEKEMERAARFANDYLAGHADLFLKRTGAYYRNMKKELIAQNGNLFVIEHNGIIKGLMSYTYEDKPEIMEALMEEELSDWEFFLSNSSNTPRIMARIINLKRMIQQVESTKEFVVAVKINDERVEENDGLFMIHCGPLGGKLTLVKIALPISENGAECCMAECEANIEDLTAFLFGYKSAKECIKVYQKSKEESLWEQFDSLKVIKRICINEIV